MSNKIDLTLIRGLPGSGKSTLARYLMSKSKGRIMHAEADMFFTEVSMQDDHATIEYKFDRRLLGAAHDWCYGDTMLSLRRGEPVIVSNPFSTRREIDRYVDGVKRSGLRVRVNIIHCTDEFENVHNVPASAIERMKARWEIYPGEYTYSSEGVEVP